MRDPYAETAAAKALEHDGVVLRNLDAEELALELVAVVVEHLGTESRSVAVEETKLDDELATVADTERECVGAGIETVKGFACFLVVEECSSPALCGAENVGIGETAAEDDHVDILKRLATAHEVGHVDILDIEASEVESVGHLAIAIDAFLTNDCSLDACLAVGEAESEALEGAIPACGQTKRKRLVLIVCSALSGFIVAALESVEMSRCAEPNIAHLVDVDIELLASRADGELAFPLRASEIREDDASLVKLSLYYIEVANLKNYSRVLCEEAHDDILVIGWDVGIDAPACVGEGHLKKSRDETASGDVMTGEDKTFLNKALDSFEDCTESSGIGHGRGLVAYTAENLGESAATKGWLRTTHVDADERGLGVAHHDRLDDLADVADLAHGGYDDSTRAKDGAAVMVLLSH